MADFMTNLWEAIFVAGPTPTLLLATNVTFAALQMLLLALLIATYSVHFVILSTLCAGLWFSINWFAAELRAVQEQQETVRKHDKEQADDRDRGDDTDEQAPTVVRSPEHLTDGNATSASRGASFAASGLSVEAAESDDTRRRAPQAKHTSARSSIDSDWEKLER